MIDLLIRLQAALAERYAIERELGQGGMAVVFLAKDLKHGRAVAIKVLRPELAMALGAKRFLGEIETVAALAHPHILPLYDSGEAAGFLYYVMPFVEGESLRDRLRRERQLPLDDALQIAREVAGALSYAHSHGLVHRDIKPENILLEAGQAVVSDFGIARAISAAGGERLTQTGLAVGTPAYMSPEQAMGETLVDGRTDVYGLGCVLYEMLAGQPPYTGPTPQAIIARCLTQPLPPLRPLRETIPAAVEQAIARALARVPADRFATAAQFAEALAESQREVPTARRRARAKPRARGAAEPKAQPAHIGRLAVLPLENLSPNQEEELFADGMTDALITTLAQIGALRVISRTSVMRYKSGRKPLPEIARELKVETVVEGTVLRSGNRVRIAAQLIHAPTDTHLWAKNYESDLRDILTLQSDVAQAIASEIQIKLTPQEQARFAQTRPVDPEAYEAFLKGRYHWYRRSPDALKRALACLQRATAKDPTYALAQAGLADAYNTLGWDLFAVLPPAEAFPKAKVAGLKALALDPNCAEAHAALGWAAAGYDWDWVTAEREFRSAIKLKPHYGPVHIWYSHFLKAMDRIAESFEESKRAIECDPLGLVLNMHMGWHYVYEREYEQAIEQLRKTLELEPGFILARLFLGEAYEQLGAFGEAIKEFEKTVNLSERHPIYLAGLGDGYAVAGQREDALRIIEELQQLSSQVYVPARGIAEVYIGLGEKEQAFTWLDEAFKQRNGWLFHVKGNPRYDSLRSDPRYTDLVRRIGLPP